MFGEDDEDEERPPLLLLLLPPLSCRSSPSDAARALEGLALPRGIFGPGQASASAMEEPGKGADDDDDDGEDGDRGHRGGGRERRLLAVVAADACVAADQSRVSATVAPDRSLASCMSSGHIHSLERAPSSTLGEGKAVRERERSGGPGPPLEPDMFGSEK